MTKASTQTEAAAVVPSAELAEVIGDGYRVLRRSCSRAAAGQSDPLTPQDQVHAALARADASRALVGSKHPLTVDDAISQLRGRGEL